MSPWQIAGMSRKVREHSMSVEAMEKRHGYWTEEMKNLAT